MQLVELRTFLAVAEEKSFSAAAQRLFITQPAISKRIQSLENHLGTPLFDRIGKRVYLTEAGSLLIDRAETMLRLAKDTEKEIFNLNDTISGRLNLATSHHIGLHRLAPVLKDFSQRYPDVQLDIQFEDSEVAYQMVRSGQVELAVVTLNPDDTDLDADLKANCIWRDPLVFVSSASEPLATTLQMLAVQPCILPGQATYTGRIVMDRFARAGLTLKPTLSTNYLETIGMLVSVGLGWSVLPRSMIGDLSVLEVNCEPISRSLGSVINGKRTLSNSASAFLTVLEDYIIREDYIIGKDRDDVVRAS
ncbi:LysR family transcriptional regulator [Pseudomonadales bacterium]|nr:LysR family transcriptional regulator [Pseudomonadales bacterium]